MAGPTLPQYKRVLLKISGEVLGGEAGFGISQQVLRRIAREIHQAHQLGVDLGVVVGGGNFYRGVERAQKEGTDRIVGDYIGMLATITNCLALQEALEDLGSDTRVLSALEIRAVCEPFILRRALRHLEKGRILLFAGGTGHPFFSTDTAAVLRAAQIGAEVILKGTDVNGVYDADPRLNPEAVLFSSLTFSDALARDLKVMDGTAFSLGREVKLPIIVFNITQEGNILRILKGERIGTLVHP
ncbi:MAG: UMP kinase [Armatimonadetes bacterium]|nr:UMP kinase [Armatimonadota bacterium]MDW8122048.1 UMP kinase [Armatimonadota bacterium]